MKLLIAYATTEGHTRKIARRLSGHLVAQGHATEVLALADADDPDLERFDGAVLAASVHMNSYQHALSNFVARHADELSALPTLLVSVSLSAAGHDADDWAGLDKIAADLSEATGWTPGRVLQVAGAYAPSRYDILRGFVMRRIIAAADAGIALDRDQEFTDWDAMFDATDDWLRTVVGDASAQGQAAPKAVIGS